jgi:putative nucleotidyltransferase with HDIG domain
MGDDSDLKNQTYLKFSQEKTFLDKSTTLRWMIGIVAVLLLAFFIHFREVHVAILDVGSYAQAYSVAQTDFQFFDERSTAILKEEAVRDIGQIYRIDDQQIRQKVAEWENAFVNSEEWRRNHEELTFEDVYNATEALELALRRVRFTDPRTLQKMREVALPTDNYLIYTPLQPQLAAKLPTPIWQGILRIANNNTPNISENAIKVVINYFRALSWSLNEDNAAKNKLHSVVQKRVSDKYTQVFAGSPIIDKGEKVSPRHIAMLQAMEKELSDQRHLFYPVTMLGSLLLATLIVVIAAVYFHRCYPHILYSNRRLGILLSVAIITLMAAKVTEFFFLTSKSNLIERIHYPLFAPLTALLLCNLLTIGVATFVTVFLTVIMSMSLAFDSQAFLYANLVAAMVAILANYAWRQRKQIFSLCAKAWLATIVVIIAFGMQNNSFVNVSVATDIVGAAIFMLLTAVLGVGLLPLLESSFGVLTDATLMEYMDPDNELIKRLTIEAPGTYQHSVIVGNLAEAAAQAINANGLFCRVASLYHDIGKVVTPQYFIENQANGVDMHRLLTPHESAQVILAHVSEGVALARKANIPEQIIDVIKEHHGTTLTWYFYHKQLELMAGDSSKVHEKDFRYVGPKPHSKESGIIMIADSVEAAARSLEEIDEAALNHLAQQLIKSKTDDGQFDECFLTMEELAIVRHVIVQTLLKILIASSHTRVKYPNKEIA